MSLWSRYLGSPVIFLLIFYHTSALIRLIPIKQRNSALVEKHFSFSSLINRKRSEMKWSSICVSLPPKWIIDHHLRHKTMNLLQTKEKKKNGTEIPSCLTELNFCCLAHDKWEIVRGRGERKASSTTCSWKKTKTRKILVSPSTSRSPISRLSFIILQPAMENVETKEKRKLSVGGGKQQ